MIVKRIVSNVATQNVAEAVSFYRDVLGLDVVMDQGWIMTLASSGQQAVPQISFASEGGSGTAVPDMSIEVDDLDEALRRVRKAGVPIEYGPADEVWGLRRFYVRDPFGKLLNILQHNSK